MMTPSDSPLPLFGFHSSQVKQHPSAFKAHGAFLYRVWRKDFPDDPSIELDPELGFVAKEWVHRLGSSKDIIHLQKTISSHRQLISLVDRNATVWTGRAVLSHVCPRAAAGKFDSPYISTSMSLPWAIWTAQWNESFPRYSQITADQICISVIRLSHWDNDPEGLAFATRYLDENTRPYSDERSAWNFATQAQEVLVYGCIPVEAVVATVTLRELRDRGGLPKWMTRGSQHPAKTDADIWAGKMRREFSEGNRSSIIDLTLSFLGRDALAEGGGMQRDTFDMMVYWAQWPFRPQPTSSAPCYKLTTEGKDASTTTVLQIWRKYGGLPVVTLGPDARLMSLEMGHIVRFMTDKSSHGDSNLKGPAARHSNLISFLKEATGSSTSILLTRPHVLADALEPLFCAYNLIRLDIRTHFRKWSDTLTALRVELAGMDKYSPGNVAKFTTCLSEYILTLNSLMYEQEAIQSIMMKAVGLQPPDGDDASPSKNGPTSTDSEVDALVDRVAQLRVGD